MLSCDEYKKLPKEEQSKEIYAYFGLSIYHFQVLEYQLINMILVYYKSKNIKMTPDEYDDVFRSYSDKTMGKLVEKVTTLYNINDTDKGSLWEILKKRNFFAHHFFKDRSMKWYSIEGRFEMIREIDEIVTHTMELDRKLELLIQPLFEKFGITQDYLDSLMGKMRKGEYEHDNLYFES